MSVEFDIGAVMRGPVVADELRKWPLMHGTLQTGRELEDIRQGGLIATKPKLNPLPFGEELGLANFVFLAPASFRLNYGYSLGAILVDPAVLQRQDLRFSDRDLGDVIDFLTILSEGHGYCGRAKETDTLAHLLEREKMTSPESLPDEWIREVLRSREFAGYCSRNYHLTEADFFERIEAEACSFPISLREYFARSVWFLREEILVPRVVESEFLLGYWNVHCWREWRKARTRETQIRLEEWLKVAAAFCTR